MRDFQHWRETFQHWTAPLQSGPVWLGSLSIVTSRTLNLRFLSILYNQNRGHTTASKISRSTAYKYYGCRQQQLGGSLTGDLISSKNGRLKFDNKSRFEAAKWVYKHGVAYNDAGIRSNLRLWAFLQTCKVDLAILFFILHSFSSPPKNCEYMYFKNTRREAF